MKESDGYRELAFSLAQVDTLSDVELVRSLVLRNEDAMAVLVDRYHRLVFSVAIRIVKDESEAEEVLQIVFLDIFRNAAQFDPSRGTLKMWVLQHAYSRSVNHRRHLQRKQFYSRSELGDVDPIKWPTFSVGYKGLSDGEAARLVEQAFSILNPWQRQAIELYFFEGLKFSEIAEKTGHTIESVRHSYYRGLVKVREFIQSSRLPGEEKSQVAGAGKFRLEVANVKSRTL